tara:strand:- start:249 stop:458 length:210 start_codon:yes stop_codon:yes gene_type:complete
MTKKKKQDIGEAIRRFREGPRMGPPKPQQPPMEQPGGEFDSPGFQSPRQRMDADKKRKQRERKGTGPVK